MRHSLNPQPLHKRNISWKFNSRPEDADVENEIVLTTPDFSFDLIIERFEDDLLRYSIRKHGATGRFDEVKRFAIADEAANYLYNRGVSCAGEMIRLGVEAIG